MEHIAVRITKRSATIGGIKYVSADSLAEAVAMLEKTRKFLDEEGYAPPVLWEIDHVVKAAKEAIND